MTSSLADLGVTGEVRKPARPMPKMAARGRTREPNPFDAVVQESYAEWQEAQGTEGLTDEQRESAGVRQITVPTDKLKDIKLKIFNAANHFDHGQNVRTEDNGDGTTEVWFRIVDRSKRGPRKAKAESNGSAEASESDAPEETAELFGEDDDAPEAE